MHQANNVSVAKSLSKALSAQRKIFLGVWFVSTIAGLAFAFASKPFFRIRNEIAIGLIDKGQVVEAPEALAKRMEAVFGSDGTLSTDSYLVSAKPVVRGINFGVVEYVVQAPTPEAAVLESVRIGGYVVDSHSKKVKSLMASREASIVVKEQLYESYSRSISGLTERIGQLRPRHQNDGEDATVYLQMLALQQQAANELAARVAVEKVEYEVVLANPTVLYRVANVTVAERVPNIKIVVVGFFVLGFLFGVILAIAVDNYKSSPRAQE